MDTIIMSDGSTCEITNWKEPSIVPPAGVAPIAQNELNRELERQGVEVLKIGEVSFDSKDRLREGELFDKTGQRYQIGFVANGHYKAKKL
jgi:hypothetical protein